ncbi:MAG: SAM hydroxide adenosyltransferase [Bacteroidales bacterium]
MKLVDIRPQLDPDGITGQVIHVDSYENAITNISRDVFERTVGGRSFDILVQSNHYVIRKLNNRYNETEEGELLALFNSAGLLEIAIRNGNASGLLRLRTGSNIRIKFKA